MTRSSWPRYSEVHRNGSALHGDVVPAIFFGEFFVDLTEKHARNLGSAFTLALAQNAKDVDAFQRLRFCPAFVRPREEIAVDVKAFIHEGANVLLPPGSVVLLFLIKFKLDKTM